MSALSGEGVGALKLALTDRAQAMMPSGEGPVVTRARHRALLGDAAAALGRAVETGPPELRGEELRLAALALGRLVGRIDVEEVLGGIFQEFCIGK
jgi:tRNA modification GTPase